MIPIPATVANEGFVFFWTIFSFQPLSLGKKISMLTIEHFSKGVVKPPTSCSLFLLLKVQSLETYFDELIFSSPFIPGFIFSIFAKSYVYFMVSE